jgi:pimeloyl-ACP methyl ester carboxylesterase
MDGRRSVAALRWSVAIAIVLAGLLWAAWRSGDRPPIDEVAVAEARLGIDLESRQIETGTARLHVVFAGPELGEPVLLLHGFPELWYSWHGVMGVLAERGYRVIAPDLRGYNRSEKPPGRDAYSGARYTEDVLGLLDALGIERVLLAGHDVGAGVAWRLVFAHPDRVRRAFILSSPHPMAWERANPSDDSESISWFRSFFRIPFLPELATRAGGWWLLSRNLRRTSRPGTFEGETLAVFQAAWARDNAISTMINVYRSGWEEVPLPADGKPSVPVRFVSGAHDAFVPEAAVDVTAEFLPAGEAFELPELSHWLLLEDPGQITALMLAFFEEPAD